jgi:Tfp pilus assembly protein FimT
MNKLRIGGHSMAEMLAAVAVLAVAAALAVPRADATVEYTRAAAAAEVAQALRFAATEARRLGRYVVFGCNSANQQARLYALTAGTSTEDLANPVLHPLDKNPYQLTFGTTTAMSNVTLGLCSFNFANGSSATKLAFAPDGAPVSLVDPNGANPIALVSASVVIVAKVASSTVTVDALTGRVTVTP